MGAIDFHVHLPTREVMVDSFGPFGAQHTEFFKMEKLVRSLDEMLRDFDKAGVERAVILGWDAETTTGLPRVPNEYIAQVVAEHPDRLIGFAGIDPHKGAAALNEMERAVRELGLSGFKFHPVVQKFYPNDPQFYPLWAKAQELRRPVLFHTGMAAWGAGMPGGGGFKLKFSNPLCLDDVAADFPELTIIAAHPSWPWQAEILAISRHKPNVYMDLSGWSPKYFPPELVQHLRTVLREKFLFGSDYPFIQPERWLSDFRQLNLPPEVVERVLEKNARRVLRL